MIFAAILRSIGVPRGNSLKLPLSARFHALPVGLLLFKLFPTISLMIVMVSLAASLGGQGGIRDIAHEFRNIVIDLFLTPYMPIGKGDIDRIGLVHGSRTFTNEKYMNLLSPDIQDCQEPKEIFLQLYPVKHIFFLKKFTE
jgi:hypothetical protein